MMNLFTDLGTLVSLAKLRAERGIYDGRVNARSAKLIQLCTHRYRVNLGLGATLIYTKDGGHHSRGWWKNPGYERCLHLSLSFFSGAHPVDFDKRNAFKIARGFFGDHVAKAWVEPSYSSEGIAVGVHHYRVFCDPTWQPIIPVGEVYSKRDTPAHWRSFSELHGYTPTLQEAPWLLAASS